MKKKGTAPTACTCSNWWDCSACKTIRWAVCLMDCKNALILPAHLPWNPGCSCWMNRSQVWDSKNLRISQPLFSISKSNSASHRYWLNMIWRWLWASRIECWSSILDASSRKEHRLRFRLIPTSSKPTWAKSSAVELPPLCPSQLKNVTRSIANRRERKERGLFSSNSLRGHCAGLYLCLDRTWFLHYFQSQ